MLQAIKDLAKKIPILGPALVALRGGAAPKFAGSAAYWEARYSAGSNSGAGSYNRLASFKADVLNRFVAERGITSVIEFGSGDGAQLQLAAYPKYIGVDVSRTAIGLCRKLFAGDASKSFVDAAEFDPATQAELALSLDVIYHLVEDQVFQSYMTQLFRSASRYVIVYASNDDQTWPDAHVRHRKFTTWVEQFQPGWRLESVIPNAYPYDAGDPNHTSFADFFVFAPASA